MCEQEQSVMKNRRKSVYLLFNSIPVQCYSFSSHQGILYWHKLVQNISGMEIKCPFGVFFSTLIQNNCYYLQLHFRGNSISLRYPDIFCIIYFTKITTMKIYNCLSQKCYRYRTHPTWDHFSNDLVKWNWRMSRARHEQITMVRRQSTFSVVRL